jgi:hypothetical protein
MKLNQTAACPLLDTFESRQMRSMTVDATAAYTTGPNAKAPLAQQVRRIFVQVGDQGLVVLDDIVPVAGDSRVLTQFQAGFPAQVKGKEALVQGKQGELHIRCFGPDVALAVAPRKFSKDWVYATRHVQWQTISGAYTCDAQKPLVSVLLPTAVGASVPQPEVRYADSRIDVKLGNGEAIAFVREGKLWKVSR